MLDPLIKNYLKKLRMARAPLYRCRFLQVRIKQHLGGGEHGALDGRVAGLGEDVLSGAFRGEVQVARLEDLAERIGGTRWSTSMAYF